MDVRGKRIARELQLLLPCQLVQCGYELEDHHPYQWTLAIKSPNNPYGGRILRVSVNFPETFPFSPPVVCFLSAVHHPNIDSSGNICLDSLKLPPAGTWRPNLSVGTIVEAVRELLQEPNLDDPLRVDVAHEYLVNQEGYRLNCALHGDNFISTTTNNAL